VVSDFVRVDLAGLRYVAFTIDAYALRIVNWKASTPPAPTSTWCKQPAGCCIWSMSGNRSWPILLTVAPAGSDSTELWTPARVRFRMDFRCEPII